MLKIMELLTSQAFTFVNHSGPIQSIKLEILQQRKIIFVHGDQRVHFQVSKLIMERIALTHLV